MASAAASATSFQPAQIDGKKEEGVLQPVAPKGQAVQGISARALLDLGNAKPSKKAELALLLKISKKSDHPGNYKLNLVIAGKQHVIQQPPSNKGKRHT